MSELIHVVNLWKVDDRHESEKTFTFTIEAELAELINVVFNSTGGLKADGFHLTSRYK